MEIRHLTKEEVVQNMLELASYICNLNDDSDSLSLEYNGLRMDFICDFRGLIGGCDNNEGV